MLAPEPGVVSVRFLVYSNTRCYIRESKHLHHQKKIRLLEMPMTASVGRQEEKDTGYYTEFPHIFREPFFSHQRALPLTYDR